MATKQDGFKDLVLDQLNGLDRPFWSKVWLDPDPHPLAE